MACSIVPGLPDWVLGLTNPVIGRPDWVMGLDSGQKSSVLNLMLFKEHNAPHDSISETLLQ
jgi:hypothetical protein